MSEIIARLRTPPFGTETSERNLMSAAADTIETLTRCLAEVTAERDEARKELDCPLKITDRSICSAGVCFECIGDRMESSVARAEKAEAERDALRAACVAAREAFDELIVWAETLVGAGVPQRDIRRADTALSTLDAVLGERDEG